MENRQNERSRQRPGHPGWRSIGQLSDLWGLSRMRTSLVVENLVESGRMEMRRVSRSCDHRREYQEETSLPHLKPLERVRIVRRTG